jgi:hypothetical protein
MRLAYNIAQGVQAELNVQVLNLPKLSELIVSYDILVSLMLNPDCLVKRATDLNQSEN